MELNDLTPLKTLIYHCSTAEIRFKNPYYRINPAYGRTASGWVDDIWNTPVPFF